MKAQLRKFTEALLELGHCYLNLARSFLRRRQTERQAHQAIQEADLLLHELQHMQKRNPQIELHLIQAPRSNSFSAPASMRRQ